MATEECIDLPAKPLLKMAKTNLCRVPRVYLSIPMRPILVGIMLPLLSRRNMFCFTRTVVCRVNATALNGLQYSPELSPFMISMAVHCRPSWPSQTTTLNRILLGHHSVSIHSAIYFLADAFSHWKNRHWESTGSNQQLVAVCISGACYKRQLKQWYQNTHVDSSEQLVDHSPWLTLLSLASLSSGWIPLCALKQNSAFLCLSVDWDDHLRLINPPEKSFLIDFFVIDQKIILEEQPVVSNGQIWLSNMGQVPLVHLTRYWITSSNSWGWQHRKPLPWFDKLLEHNIRSSASSLAYVIIFKLEIGVVLEQKSLKSVALNKTPHFLEC